MTDLPNIAFRRGNHICFHGAKLTVFVGRKIVTLLRDDICGISNPNHWDLPGGGRENGESPWECAARETIEEVALKVSRSDLLWARPYQSGTRCSWFFVAQVAPERACELQLGDEGQSLQLMHVDDYLTHPMAITSFQTRLADWIASV